VGWRKINDGSQPDGEVSESSVWFQYLREGGEGGFQTGKTDSLRGEESIRKRNLGDTKDKKSTRMIMMRGSCRWKWANQV